MLLRTVRYEIWSRQWCFISLVRLDSTAENATWSLHRESNVSLLSFLLLYKAVSLCISFPVFRDKVLVLSSRVEFICTFEHLYNVMVFILRWKPLRWFETKYWITQCDVPEQMPHSHLFEDLKTEKYLIVNEVLLL